jgi:gamma-glutamyltranspeptidase / glutathione hydrolase
MIDLTQMDGYRPAIRGQRHVVASGHHLASQAAMQILEAGGNAVDAGVAGGLALAVVQSHYVNFAGVAPIILYLPEKRNVVTISGLGTWPRAATAELFERQYRNTIPEGLLRTVVPAAPDAWITALDTYGTMSFSEVASAAITLAGNGFAMYPHMEAFIAERIHDYRRWESNAEIYLPFGKPPRTNAIFRQTDLASLMKYMCDEEKSASDAGRRSGLEAARRAFYTGDIAATIVDYHARNGGLLTREDMGSFRVEIERPVRFAFEGVDLYTCGPWCQGPTLSQAASLLRRTELEEVGHNSVQYVNHVAAALNLAFEDRDRYYGDPRFVDVPLDRLLSNEHIASQRSRLKSGLAASSRGAMSTDRLSGTHGDTSYIAVIDSSGIVFSATPSDVSYDTLVIPGTGICPSSRGSQSWADSSHPSCVAPGKRPRLTPNPAIVIRDGEFIMPFGSPGGDVQCQAMLQVLLNVIIFGMNPQSAVEQPRFATFDFPDSFEPHLHRPKRLCIEDRFPRETGRALSALGHDLEIWPHWTWKAGGVCLISKDLPSGVLTGAADPRRTGYVVGW